MHILVFGDSITQGFYDKEKGGWANRLFIDVSASLESYEDFIGVFNLGIDSETTTGLLKRIENEIVARTSNEMVIIFDIGGNDTFKDNDTGKNAVSFKVFSENYLKLITTAKKYGKVFCLGLHDFNPEQAKLSPWYDDFDMSEKDDKQYDQEIQRLAQANDAHYLSLKGILSVDFQKYSHDGDHPTSQGHQLIYERVKGELEKAGIMQL